MDTTEANDLQFCLRKILKLLAETCLSCLVKHPFVPLFFLSFFFLYISFPLVFWVLVYSFPVFVGVFVITGVYKVRRAEEDNDIKLEHRKPKEEVVVQDQDHSKNVKVKRTITRVHSVRRRRAKLTDIQTDNDDNNNNTTAVEEEKNTISSTNYKHETIDKTAQPQKEAPKEIREVEVTNPPVTNNDTNKAPSPSPLQTLKAQLNDEGYRLKCLEALRLDDKETKDDQKNVIMDVGVESNKRLENLIARRRSRKTPLHVRRPSTTFMNADKKDILQAQGPQLPSLIIPKHNIGLHFRNSSIAPLSPGSAPSVLVPMRNPFDLPYDPQEEKPDLTEDSFLQEFLTNINKGDQVYCRHQSFNLRSAFSPPGIDDEGDEASFEYETGFGRRESSRKFPRFSRTASEFDMDFSRLIEEESEKDPKSKSPKDMTKNGDDLIEEVIHKEDREDVQERTSPVQEHHDSSLSSSSRSSSDEEEREYKIDKEAILKSLSSIVRRRMIEEMRNKKNQQMNSQYANDDQTTVHWHHAPSNSIASDMQVEVSEVGSPPAVNDESLSLTYNGSNASSILDGDYGDDKKISSTWSSGDSSSESRPSSPSPVMGELNKNAEKDEGKDDGISRMGLFNDTALSINSKESNDDDNDEQSIRLNGEPPEAYDSTVKDLHQNIDSEFRTEGSPPDALPVGTTAIFPIPVQENEQQQQQEEQS